MLSLRVLVLGVCLLAASVAPAAAQSIWHVDAHAASDVQDGWSWDQAFNRLSDALEMAERGDEIWIAQGTYTPAGDGPTATFQLKNGVELYGGFAGTERLRRERQPTKHLTILSGDLAGDDAQGRYTDNAYHVVTGSGTDRTAVLDGVVVTGGRTADAPDRSAYGAGMLNEGGSPTLRRTVFRDNGSMVGGGGMANFDDSRPLIVRCAFLDNAGGAMHNDASAPTIRESLFRSNRSMGAGGAMVNRSGSRPTIIATAFAENVAANSDGGALANFDSEVYIHASTFEANEAPRGNGGAILNLESTVRVVNSTFVGNKAGRGGGGALSSARSDVDVVNSTVTHNQAGSIGGGVLNFASDVNLVNTIVGDNQAVRHPMQMVTFDRSSVELDASVIDHVDRRRMAYWDAQLSEMGTYNYRQSPRFLQAPTSGSDGTWGTPDDAFGDLRLRDDSPAVDAGFTTALNFDGDANGQADGRADVWGDLYGERRVKNGAVDIGATEGTPLHVQRVRQGDVVDVPDVGVTITFHALGRPNDLRAVRHPVVTRGVVTADEQLDLPRETELAQPTRWEIALRDLATLRADVCLTPDDPALAAPEANEIRIYKRDHAGRGAWQEQTTERRNGTLCATDVQRFSEFVILRDLRSVPTRMELAGLDDEAGLDTPTRLQAPRGDRVLRLSVRTPQRATGNTRIHYALPNDGPVLLRLYDENGRSIYTVVDQHQRAGSKQAVIEPGTVAPGVYYAWLSAAGYEAQRRVVIADPR